MTAPLLRVERLSQRFPDGTQALADVNLVLAPGELVVVLGSNGSGKSTMLRCIVRLQTPTCGRIFVEGTEISALRGRSLRQARRSIAMVSQQANLVRRRTALANVACGALGRRRGIGTKLGLVPADDYRQASDHLASVGLAALAHQRAGTLSGGEAQRVAIARALAQRPAVLLADEPVASLDPEAAEEIMGMLAALAKRGLGVLCVLHQPELALRYADRIVGLRNGSIVFDEVSAGISASRVSSLYAA